MRRVYWMVPLAAICALAAVLSFQPARSPARQADSPPATTGAGPAGPTLPVTRVVLFSSGVGYFQRDGQVDGNARVDLAFPVRDVNDLLKSMILQDLNGGQVSAVNYDSHDPVNKTLQSFAINLTDNPSFADILNQARGERVEVILRPLAANESQVQGTILGVEKQKESGGKDAVVDVEYVNIWTDQGMRSLKLKDVQRIHFANPVIDSEIQRALHVLALSHDTQKKSVTLNFSGNGQRQVRVGYVVESPIWKTSYRLVLADKDKPFLQGWAVVENPTDDDWNNVRMSLVSGRPISFQMDLYQPLYVKRPVVEPELFASLRPPEYSGAMQANVGGGMLGGAGGAPAAPAAAAKSLNAPMRRAAPTDALRGEMLEREASPALRDEADKMLRLQQGVASAATASALGDYFQYVIDHPVTLPRQKSGLLPIVNKEVEGTRVSIYNRNTHAKFPMLGLKFHNTSGLHLMQGPVTVFDGNSYAGDARIPDLQPGEERLLSYAIDLGTEVDPVSKRDPDRVTAVRIQKGILYATSKVRETVDYKVKNRSEHDRTLLIEHPFRPEYHLAGGAKPAERARDVYRFEVKVPAGKEATEEVIEERDLQQVVALTNVDDNYIHLFLRNTVLSDRVKEALRRALELKGKWEATQQEIGKLQEQLRSITEDQARLRANLKEMPQTAAAYKRYLDKFDSQESEIEKLQTQLKQSQQTAQQQRQEYEAFLAGLDVG